MDGKWASGSITALGTCSTAKVTTYLTDTLFKKYENNAVGVIQV